MSEPTIEELLARIAELEKRAEAKKSGKDEIAHAYHQGSVREEGVKS